MENGTWVGDGLIVETREWIWILVDSGLYIYILIVDIMVDFMMGESWSILQIHGRPPFQRRVFLSSSYLKKAESTGT